MSAARDVTLVVGAGHAGISLVTALRELGDERPVALVGEEPEPPYDRPPLSKSYLRGEHDRASLVFRGPSWFAEHGIDLVTGDRVASIERDRTGGLAVTASGREFRFARLALATGASNRTLDVEGCALDGVFSLRTLADADLLRERLERAESVVVVGGGFIGLEVAASATALGRSVTVVELAEHLLSRSVTPAVSAFLARAHERRGTRILLGHSAIRIIGDAGRVTGVGLTDGSTIPADLVVVGVGAVPRTELAELLGLRTLPGGIEVDERAVASDGVTVAIGDCALAPNPFSRGAAGLRRFESVQHATDHARTAAATLTGAVANYTAVPWFWSDQADITLQIAGLPMDADETVVRGDVATEAFSVLGYRGGLLVSAECLGSPHDYVAVKRGLEKGLTIDATAAHDVAVPLKRLLRQVENGVLP